MLGCLFGCAVPDVSNVPDAFVFKARQFKEKIFWLVFMVDGHNAPSDVVFITEDLNPEVAFTCVLLK